MLKHLTLRYKSNFFEAEVKEGFGQPAHSQLEIFVQV